MAEYRHIQELKYFTHYDLKQCLSFLKNKNIYDVFDYNFEYTDDINLGQIIFTKCNTHICGNIRTKYEISIKTQNSFTIIIMLFLNDIFNHSSPCISANWVDEFMKQKLDAERINKGE